MPTEEDLSDLMDGLSTKLIVKVTPDDDDDDDDSSGASASAAAASASSSEAAASSASMEVEGEVAAAEATKGEGGGAASSTLAAAEDAEGFLNSKPTALRDFMGQRTPLLHPRRNLRQAAAAAPCRGRTQLCTRAKRFLDAVRGACVAVPIDLLVCGL